MWVYRKWSEGRNEFYQVGYYCPDGSFYVDYQTVGSETDDLEVAVERMRYLNGGGQ